MIVKYHEHQVSLLHKVKICHECDLMLKLESKRREILKIKKSLRCDLANPLGQKLCVESVHRVMRPGLLVHLTFTKIQNVSALAAKHFHKELRLDS